MNVKKIVFCAAVMLGILHFISGLNLGSDKRPGPNSLFAADPFPAEADTVRVIVRFARVRNRPDASARIVKEIGYGTLLKVLGRSGDYLQVAALDAAAPGAADPWYVLRSEVDAVQPALEQALVEKRRVSFSPANPAAGQPVLFTASRFRTPKLLRWDMGDETVLTSGSQVSQGQDATILHMYAVPGTYRVKVFDDDGNMSLPPVTTQVTVAAFARVLRFSPEQPQANHPVAITAFNFKTPERIAWDLGDGTEIKPGAGPGVVRPSFQVSHVYEKAGTYNVRAYDSGGDKSQPPLVVEVQVAADPRRILVAPSRAEAGKSLEFNAVNFNTPERLRWDMGDGTVIPSEKEAGVQVGSLLNYSYKKPGNYLVKAYDWNGDATRRPVQFVVTVTSPAAAAAVKLVPPAPEREAVPGTVGAATRKKYALIKFSPFAGYFQPKDEFIRQIYGEGDLLYGARLGIHVWEGFYFWFSASQFKVIGKTTVTEDKTTLTLLPVSGAMLYHLGRGFFVPYAGIGLTLLSYKEEAELVGSTKGHGSSVFLEGGLELRMNRHFSIDLGARIGQVKVQPENAPKKVDLGGLQTTVALLVSF